MAKFFSPALAILSRVHRIKSTQTQPDTIDLGPIQLVHDVAREAELGSGPLPGLGGFLLGGITVTHAAADIQTASLEPYNPSLTWPPWSGAQIPNDAVFWLVGVSNAFAAGVDPTWAVSVAVPAFRGVAQTIDFPICGGSGAGVTFFESVAPDETSPTLFQAPGILPFPLVPQNFSSGQSLITLSSSSLAAGSHRIMLKLWLGTLGTTPPGYS